MSEGVFSIRRSIQWVWLLFLIIVCCSSDNYIAWITITFIFGTILMVDYMFCDDENFRFDPDYQNYARYNDPHY